MNGPLPLLNFFFFFYKHNWEKSKLYSYNPDKMSCEKKNPIIFFISLNDDIF